MDNLNQELNPRGGKPRQRVSVACVYCRSKRVKCVSLGGQSGCEQCFRYGITCVYHQEGAPSSSDSVAPNRVGDKYAPTERSEPKTYDDLTESLESAQSQPKERQQQQQQHDHTTQSQAYSYRRPSRLSSDSARPIMGNNPRRSDALKYRLTSNLDYESFDSLPSGRDADLFAEPVGHPTPLTQRMGSGRSPANSSSSESSEELVDKLLSTSGHLGFDNMAGSVRYFGPTTNLHVYWNPNGTVPMHQASESRKKPIRAISEMSVDTYDHLMDCFWRYHNSILRVVDRDEFYRDKENDGSTFFSGFLQICILAIGFRFSDKSRPDIRRLMLAHAPRESTLHKEAKRLFEYELESLGGLPSIQALLLLGDLECGCGRDNTGWMFAGMACRLCFDMGLNRDCSALGLSQDEVKVRQTVLWACIVYDKYWALYLGRSTSIKSSDIDVDQLTHQFDQINTGRGGDDTKAVESLTYDALLNLMEIAGKITGDNDMLHTPSYQQSCLKVAALNRELQDWHSKLPSRLHWTPTNIATAKSPFFLLHQQYHASLALLHRPFAHLKRETQRHDHEDRMATISRRAAEISLGIYLENARRVAEVLKEHCRRFDAARLCLNTLHHVGTAAIAFVFGTTLVENSSDRAELTHLESLTQVLADMSATYQPAERMLRVLDNVLSAFGHGTMATHRPEYQADLRSTVPARRPSSTVTDHAGMPAKKRQADSFSANSVRGSSSTRELGLEHPTSPFDIIPSTDGIDMGPAVSSTNFQQTNLGSFYPMSFLDGANDLGTDFNDMNQIGDIPGDVPDQRRDFSSVNNSWLYNRDWT